MKNLPLIGGALMGLIELSLFACVVFIDDWHRTFATLVIVLLLDIRRKQLTITINKKGD